MFGLLSNWVQRHRHPFNWAIHLLGIPLGNLAPLVLAARGNWWWAAGALAGGYVLQFLGHAVEGNDPGEVIVIKKLLGRPYVAQVARHDSVAESDPSGVESPEAAPRQQTADCRRREPGALACPRRTGS